MEKLTVSHSSLSRFKSCRRKFKYDYVDRLSPRGTTSPLATGTAIHDAFESYFKGESATACSKEIFRKFDEHIANAGPFEVEDMTVSKHIALGMWDFYPSKLAKFDRIYPEQRFQIPTFHNVDLIGYLDGLVIDGGKYWIRELKTTGLNMTNFKARADVSYQSTAYIWAMQKILRERVQGAYIDIIRKPLIRKRKTETCDEFAARNYDLYKDTKNHKDLYSRHFSYRSDHQLSEFEDDLKADIECLMDALDKGRFQRNTDSCFMFGRECPYKKICWLENPDQDLLDAYFKPKEPRHGDGKVLTLSSNDLEEPLTSGGASRNGL